MANLSFQPCSRCLSTHAGGLGGSTLATHALLEDFFKVALLHISLTHPLASECDMHRTARAGFCVVECGRIGYFLLLFVYVAKCEEMNNVLVVAKSPVRNTPNTHFANLATICSPLDKKLNEN
jgi:hypothetical protein